MMRNECFSDGYFEGVRWAAGWTAANGTEYGTEFVDGIKSALEGVTLGYAIDVNGWNEGFVYGARQVARDFERFGIVPGDVGDDVVDDDGGEDGDVDVAMKADPDQDGDPDRLEQSADSAPAYERDPQLKGRIASESRRLAA